MRRAWLAAAGAICAAAICAAWLRRPALATPGAPPAAVAVVASQAVASRAGGPTPVRRAVPAALPDGTCSTYAGGAPVQSAAVRAANARVRAALRADPQPQAQAVSAFLDLDDEARLDRLARLARLAIDSDDAHVYGLAFRACFGKDPAPASCRSLDARRWIALDPGNGYPWIYVLADAEKARDDDGAAQAVRELLAADRLDADSAFAPRAIGAAGAPADEAGVLDLAITAIGIAAAEAEPRTSLGRACRADGDPAARERCIQWAARMATRADQPAWRAMGRQLAARMAEPGTPDAIRTARHAEAARRVERSSMPHGPVTGCRAMADAVDALVDAVSVPQRR